jgi:starch phosphorylase
MQEVLLGVGGVILFRKLGIHPGVFHMNEGHAAFLTLELAREKIAEGVGFDHAIEAVKQECIFTTHTPVEAGHDRFSADLMHYVLGRYASHLQVDFDQMMDLGRVHKGSSQEPFCMTVLALRCSRAANGVSELHGEVSREMWQALYPGRSIKDVPIGHITNGIHLMGWMKGPLRNFWKRHLGDSWDRTINETEFWQKLEDPEYISDEELWALRYDLRREMIEFTRRRLLLQEQYLDRQH